MVERASPERICPQCGLKTMAMICPEHDLATLACIAGAVDTVQTGEIISGRYRVDKLLGKGGFGAVFRATHVVTQQELVLKVLKPNLGEDETQVKRFLQEARTASKLSHPNTVRVYDFGQTDAGHLYLAMELLHGQELGQVLLEHGVLPPERAIHIAIGVLKSLAEAHHVGLVHRDLKPDNIFLCKVLGEDDFVKVIDFGIAKPIDQGDDGGLTRTGFTVGTPKYMSPEQVLNKGVEGRSDLYSLGVILYQCLSGELPLSGPSPVETMMAHVQQEPAALSLICEQPLPDGLEAVVMRALRKQASQRFLDAEDMRAALEDVQEAAGLTTGRKARSAKLRAVTPQDLETTAPHAVMRDSVPGRPAPHLELAKKEPTPARTVTPHTEDGIDATRVAAVTPIHAAKTLTPPAVKRPTAQTKRPAPVHTDATLDLPGLAPPVAATARRSPVLAIVGVVAALVLAAAAWFVLGNKPEATPPPATAPEVAAPTPVAAPAAAPVAAPAPATTAIKPPAVEAVAAPVAEPAAKPVADPAVEATKAVAKPAHKAAAKPKAAKPNGDEAL